MYGDREHAVIFARAVAVRRTKHQVCFIGKIVELSGKADTAEATGWHLRMTAVACNLRGVGSCGLGSERGSDWADRVSSAALQ